MPEIEWTVDGIAPRIETFLDPLLDAADFDLDYDIFAVDGRDEAIGPEIAVDFDGGDAGLLLENRAEVLLALEQLTLEALRVPHHDRYRLIFDVDDYRLVRIEELCRTAEAAADRVKRTGGRFEFRPMTSRERRIIHLALRHEREVTTHSEGMPPRRYTIVEPSKGRPA